MCVWSALRALLVAEPYVFTSSNSCAYFRLASASGPSERNCEPLWRRKGRTSFSHPFGSLTSAGGTGRHWPGSDPTANRNDPKRPSSVRAAIIAAAAALPTAIPRVLDEPSGIPISEAAYCASNVACCVGARCESILYAAVAAAASFESDGVATRDVSRY